MTQAQHYWAVSRGNGLQFKECLACGKSTTVEYHFDGFDGDTVECEHCGEPHELFGL